MTINAAVMEENIFYLLIFSFLLSGTKTMRDVEFGHAMSPEFGGKWETERLNIRFPPPTLLCARYSVKLSILMLI